MSKSDSPFRSELEDAVFNAKRIFVDNARSSTPIREHLLPFGIRLFGIELQGKLPGNLIMENPKLYIVKTGAETSVYVRLSLSMLQIRFEPGLHIDVFGLGESSLTEIMLIFGEATPRLNMRDIGSSIDPGGLIRFFLMKNYGESIRNSAFAQPGYDWTRDPRLFDNLNNFYASIVDPKTPRGPFVANLILDSLALDGQALSEQQAGDKEAEIIVFPHSSIKLTIDFQVSLSSLIDAIHLKKPQVAVDAITPDRLKLNCPLHLFFGGQEIGRIDSLEISDDCRVFIQDFTIVHPQAATAENSINSATVTLAVFWNLLIEGLRLANLAQTSQTVVEPLRAEAVQGVLAESLINVVGAAKAKPNIVVGTIKNELEPKLTEKIRQIVHENLHTFGLDFTRLFAPCKDLR